MALTRAQLDECLHALEARVPTMMRDRNGFPRAFEDETDRLIARASESDRGYVYAQLEAIIERSGFNR